MAIKFQYNKTSLQQLQKELKVRLNALPTLQAKESALRLEVKKAKAEVTEIEERLEKNAKQIAPTHRLWVEFPDRLISITDVSLDIKKIAGVKTPIFNDVKFEVERLSLFLQPWWIPSGLELLKDIARLKIEKEVVLKKVDILEYARKKTTQKVNLYEKVQIPSYEEAILKIKRFLEDEENLAKSSQKILKNKIAATEATA
ncbi:MAG: V-type ATP synthase subunit D [Chitinivibrionales bacterium]|nr:V-type ATP synthase subunit D [Chitinivibrionales bacterium]